MNQKPDSEPDTSVQIVEFNNKHIERSKVVRRILDIYAVDSILEDEKKRKEITKNKDADIVPESEEQIFKRWSEEPQ